MKKKLIAILLAGALVVSTLMACTPSASPDPEPGGDAEVETDSGTESETEVESETDDEPIVVNAVLQLNPEIVLEDNPVVAEIERRLNIVLNIEAPPVTGYGDRVQMMMATGDMPDLLHFGADIFATQWAEEGLLLELSDLIPHYPNLSQNISAEQFGDTMFLDTGGIYGVPKPNSYDQWGFLINRVWLDNLGLEPPRTVDEFIEVARAFTFDDPTGTGADTFGASLHAQSGSMDSGIWHLMNDFLSTAFHISSWHHGLPDADGSAQLRAHKSGYEAYLQLLRDLFEEGIIDREFITHSGEEAQEKFAQQRVGIIGASQGSYMTNIIERYSLNAEDYLFMPPLVLNEGDRPIYAMPPSNWMAYYINANSPPEVQDAVLRILDFANSEEGFILMHFGIEGVHFNSYCIETRTIDRTPEQAEEASRVTSNWFAMANAFDDRRALEGGSTPENIAIWQEQASAAQAATTNVFFGFTKMLDRISVDFPDDVQRLNSLEVRFVTGEVSLEELMEFVNGRYREITADIAQELQDFMTENPPRFENE